MLHLQSPPHRAARCACGGEAEAEAVRVWTASTQSQGSRHVHPHPDIIGCRTVVIIRALSTSFNFELSTPSFGLFFKTVMKQFFVKYSNSVFILLFIARTLF
jgi:hypothetical protein